ncbi:MAG: redoxin domain-containing protein [Deltaproteobacteria bacterium]|nr:redoxin domain-containing protein [Deltaproteobacteria bacterium]RLB87650.1 MAG: alkyl hydroperoxide reductase [Deltaproteobacteria bacterium]RLB91001.1 MAG: alkyl hydroperoxide reductase [Deltaproteobacteria bacterium]RLC11496.1 MAG: alkyl hydroperoxide reductase [Deltaproteobacteria bacterium]
MTAVAAKYEDLKKLDVEVLSVSVDSQFVHKVWQTEELSKMVEGGVPFPMVSDGAGKIGSVYGVYDEAAGVNVRGRFIIDPDGVIQAIEILTPPVGRNVSELFRQIQAFRLVRKTNGAEVAPSGWQPGKPTLKPGPELVGKVWEVWKPDLAF